MKLTPRPPEKAARLLPGSTSTKPKGKDSSPTKPEIRLLGKTLTNVEYSGIGPQGQAVPTENQKARQKQGSTQLSIGIFAASDLNIIEMEELRILGVMMSKMTWVHIYTDCEPVALGVTQGEGTISELGDRLPKDLDRCIMYRYPVSDDLDKVKVVGIGNYTQLHTFTTGTITVLYRRGILT